MTTVGRFGSICSIFTRKQLEDCGMLIPLRTLADIGRKGEDCMPYFCFSIALPREEEWGQRRTHHSADRGYI